MRPELASPARRDDPRANDPRTVLARHGLGAKKSWGQNFLVDRSVVARIAAALAFGSEDVVVEIGAGLGTLTGALLADASRPRRVIAIEREPDMVGVLKAELGDEPRLEIRAEDAAAFDFAAAAAAAGRPLVVVGNLPYQISSALLFSLVDAGPAVSRAVVMVQREVAQRMAAPPGDKVYGRLSVMLQQQMAARLLFHVRPGSFFPAPRVTSSVVALDRRAVPLAPVANADLFAKVVRDVFSVRRKMLRRSLGQSVGDEVAARGLAAADIDGTRRPEELSVPELGRLSDAIGTILAEQGHTLGAAPGEAAGMETGRRPKHRSKGEG